MFYSLQTNWDLIQLSKYGNVNSNSQNKGNSIIEEGGTVKRNTLAQQKQGNILNENTRLFVKQFLFSKHVNAIVDCKILMWIG